MNIWEVICVSDLINILNSSPKQFVIIGIVLETTPKELQTTIKRFLKSKAKNFPNMKFLFFKANQKYLGKISFLETDETQYPYIYHIFDTSNIFIKVNCANQNTILESFKVGEEYYNKDLQLYINNKYNPVNNIILKQQIKILEQRPKDFNIELLKDIQQRKIDESIIEKKDEEITLDEEEIDNLKDELWN
jgi:hypothetical protein